MTLTEDLPFYEVAETIGLNPTERALIAREVDSALARRLRRDGWTFGKLQQEDDASLEALGLSSESISLFRSSGRPEIPSGYLFQTLIANRFICCVCHEPERAIIVHHIEPWAKWHDHSPANLAVLCEIDHGKAHSRSDLTRNLDTDAIRAFKAVWEESNRNKDTEALRSASRVDHDAWWYFNHRRLFELAQASNVPLAAYARQAVRGGLATVDGLLTPRPHESPWMYQGSEGMALYAYVRTILHAVMERLTIRNISDHLDISVLEPLLKRGDFIFVQGAHQFSRKNAVKDRINQLSWGCRKANGVEVKFTFDLWEATSCSAHGYLRGRSTVGCLVRVVDLARIDGVFTITGSVLAIAAAFNGLQQREYGGPFSKGLIKWSTDESDFDLDDMVEPQ